MQGISGGSPLTLRPSFKCKKGNVTAAAAAYVANNTQAVSTNLITGTLEIYMCVSDKEADA